MEKLQNENKNNLTQNKTQTEREIETLKLIAREECFLEGITEVVTVNESLFEAKLKDAKIIIKGHNLHINKLDLTKEYVGLSGKIEEIKYSNPILKKLPRLFK